MCARPALFNTTHTDALGARNNPHQPVMAKGQSRRGVHVQGFLHRDTPISCMQAEPNASNSRAPSTHSQAQCPAAVLARDMSQQHATLADPGAACIERPWLQLCARQAQLFIRAEQQLQVLCKQQLAKPILGACPTLRERRGRATQAVLRPATNHGFEGGKARLTSPHAQVLRKSAVAASTGAVLRTVGF